MDEYVLTKTNDQFDKFIQIDKNIEEANKTVVINKFLIINRIENGSAEYYVNNESTNRLNKVSVQGGDLTSGKNNSNITNLPKIK